MKKITGKFSVEMLPIDIHQVSPNSKRVAFYRVTKKFSGSMAGNSFGVMQSHSDKDYSNAGYVFLEEFEGELDGLSGGFILQHSGTIVNGSDSLSLDILPGSGMDKLSGISGKMNIERDGDNHSYTLEYTLGD